ncbi:SDR family NAD(P)-dependent oxidoreductase [Arthrobacter sp. NamB2]|uniref:SDR family NAD(P)-dependent oxidoreductase n=1 Tax=Arthrobacter sp. NamB2 TaxID=2576035 RepID=UPI0010C9884A|nr:SDR family NAD(P)-dependent oxidoreductase [Arthrobacter sp. NamB2]TKV29809.1 SDR family NAD(P)-dependent oxidoreductase [Arthrobacter sp. NamB2]
MWSPVALPPLTGHRVLVTGGNAGLGYFACEQLAGAGAGVVMASRSEEKATSAIRAIRTRVPDADITFQPLDLANLASVRAAATTIAEGPSLTGLLANAGVVRSHERKTTAEGYELLFGTNHLGHYALLALLLPKLSAAGTRIVHLGSISHRWAHLTPSSLQPATYRNTTAYATSKLAVMAFGFELARRLELTGSAATSVVAHPGLALGMFTPRRQGVAAHRDAPRWRQRVMKPVAQGKDEGAWPLVRAAGDPTIPNGAYCGPDGWFQLKGRPALVRAEPRAREANAASRLIDLSAELTGIELRF